MRPPPVNPPIPDWESLDIDGTNQLRMVSESLVGHMKLWWPLIEPARKFDYGWHIGCVAAHLEELANPASSMRNLIINVPPRFSKSLQVCVFWPTWVWRKYPASRWMFASFAHDLVQRDSQRCRDIIGHPLYQHLWGVRVRNDQDTMMRFTNQHQGFRYAITVGGQGMGEGADFICVDDPINPRKATSALERAKCIHWWRAQMSRRVTDERTTRKIIIMQRLHEEDLTGYLMAEGLGWDHLVLPMRYEPRRYWFPDSPMDAGPVKVKGGDGAVEVPAEIVAEQEKSKDWGNALEEAWLAAVGAVEKNRAAPRDSIRMTSLQQRCPEWQDGPDGSGRSQEGDLLWPERFPEKEVAKAESELQSEAPGQYQQRPSGEAGDMFRRETFRRFEPMWKTVEDEQGNGQSVFAGVRLHGPGEEQVREFRADQLLFFQTFDTALTEGRRSAYTAAATVFATPEFDMGIWNIFRARLNVPDQFPAIMALREHPQVWLPKLRKMVKQATWPQRIAFQAVEPKASGIGLIQQAAAEGRPFHPLRVDGDKVQRAGPLSTMYANGKVYHPTAAIKWVNELEDELMTFPNSTFKDQVDCLAHASILLVHDKIVRAQVVRPMADVPPADGEKADDPFIPPQNEFEFNIGGQTVKVEWPDDDEDPFDRMGVRR